MNKKHNDEEFFRFCMWQRILKNIGNSMTPITQTEIAERLCMEKATIYINLYGLEKAGLIVRVRIEKGVNVSLTSRGRLLWKALSDIENIIGKRIG